MGKIGVVTCSSISKTELIKTSQLIVGEVELSMFIDEKEYTSNTISQGELFELMRNGAMPKTAQPSPGHIKATIDKGFLKYDKIIAVMPHESLSGTYQNFYNVAREHEKSSEIFVIASNSIAVSELAVVTKAIELIELDENYDVICNELVKFNDRIITYAYPGSTSHLRKSGRITNSQALILGALHIRVQIKCDGGPPYSSGKGRGEKFVLKNIKEELSKLEVEHVYYSSLEESPKLRAAIFEMFKKNGYTYTETDPADAIPSVHFGENTLGFTVVCK